MRPASNASPRQTEALSKVVPTVGPNSPPSVVLVSSAGQFAPFAKNLLDLRSAYGQHGDNPRGFSSAISPQREGRSMIRRLLGLVVLPMAFVASGLILSVASIAQQAPRYAGPTERGFLLPNGWILKPAGEQVALADLPLNIIALADNRHALAATAGYNAHELSLIDLDSKTVVDRQAVTQSWFGLAANAKGNQIWWSGGGGNRAARISA